MWKHTRATGELPHQQLLWQTEDPAAPRWLSALEATSIDWTTQRAHDHYLATLRAFEVERITTSGGDADGQFHQAVLMYLAELVER